MCNAKFDFTTIKPQTGVFNKATAKNIKNADG